MKQVFVRLHMNESPYPPPPLAVEMARRYASFLNLYEVEHLREELLGELGRYAGVDRRFIDIYAGSSALLTAMLSLAKATKVDVVIPHPTFFILYDLARAYGVRLVPVRLRGEGFELRPEELLRAARGRLVYLANPNNPTGNLLIDSEDVIAKLAAEARFLFLDEAYYEFSRRTFCSLALERENVAVLRSLSKAFCIAGARVGYVVASPRMLGVLERFRVGYEVSVTSQAAALGALRSLDYVQKVVEEVIKTREWTRRRLSELSLAVVESRTNFLLAKLPIPCSEFQRRLKRAGFMVMCFSDVPDLRMLGYYVRVSVGRPEHMARFIDVLAGVVGKAF